MSKHGLDVLSEQLFGKQKRQALPGQLPPGFPRKKAVTPEAIRKLTGQTRSQTAKLQDPTIAAGSLPEVMAGMDKDFGNRPGWDAVRTRVKSFLYAQQEKNGHLITGLEDSPEGESGEERFLRIHDEFRVSLQSRGRARAAINKFFTTGDEGAFQSLDRRVVEFREFQRVAKQGRRDTAQAKEQARVQAEIDAKLQGLPFTKESLMDSLSRGLSVVQTKPETIEATGIESVKIEDAIRRVEKIEGRPIGAFDPETEEEQIARLAPENVDIGEVQPEPSDFLSKLLRGDPSIKDDLIADAFEKGGGNAAGAAAVLSELFLDIPIFAAVVADPTKPFKERIAALGWLALEVVPFELGQIGKGVAKAVRKLLGDESFLLKNVGASPDAAKAMAKAVSDATDEQLDKAVQKASETKTDLQESVQAPDKPAQPSAPPETPPKGQKPATEVPGAKKQATGAEKASTVADDIVEVATDVAESAKKEPGAVPGGSTKAPEPTSAEKAATRRKPELKKPPPEPEVTGLARRFDDPERLAAGKVPQTKSSATPEGLAETGRKLVSSGAASPDEVLSRVLKGGTPTPNDAAVIEYQKLLTLDDQAKVLDMPDGPDKSYRLHQLDTALDEYSEFGKVVRGQFHELGLSLQIAHDRNTMRFVSLRNEARALNFGEDLSTPVSKQLRDLSSKYEVATKEIERLRNELSASFIKRSSRAGRGDPSARRASALNRLRDLGINTIDAGPTGGLKSKQAGAVRVPQFGGVSGQVSQAVKDLASSHIAAGVTDFDELVSVIAKDVPGMAEDDILIALSRGMRKYRTDQTVAGIAARRVMNGVSRKAEFRMKSPIDKVLSVSADVGKNLKRLVQASYDASAFLLQGKPALLARPGSWLKSWEAFGKAISAKPGGTRESAERLWAELLNDPVIREAHEQGWLSLREPGSKFTASEEIFRGNLADYIPGVARSDNMFSSPLNSMYGDWYRKVVSQRPDDVNFKRSIGAIINIFSGRGHGNFSDMLSNPAWGWLAYAPRYAYSLAQLGTGAPIWLKGLSPAARLEAAKAYAGMLSTIYAINKIAPLFGYTVENDPRSVNYGMIADEEGRQVDGYNKITQFPRLMIQTFYGKKGSRDQFKAPGDYGFEPLEEYISNNYSPALRDLMMISTGRVWDFQKREMRNATPADFAWSFAPLSAQDIARSEDKSAFTAIAALLGGRPSEKDLTKKPGDVEAPDFTALPPGLQRLISDEPKKKKKRSRLPFTIN